MKKILIAVFLLFLVCQKINATIVVMDSDSGRVLYSKDMNERKLIASTTKIMTSIIALENSNLDKKLKVGNEIKEVYGSMVYIKEGEEFTLKDLLYGLMLQSGNDAAMTISTKTLGYDNFIAEMNIKAYKLGMYNTSFENPHGLNETTKNYSTAYDMALLMKYAIKNKDFLDITSTQKYTINNYIWYNKNELLEDYKYTISGKIGYTQASGPVFVSAARKDNKGLIIVSIDEDDKFNLHKSLYEKYFDMYDKYKILDKNTFTFKSKNEKFYHYYLKNDFNMLLTHDELNKVKINVKLNDNFDYVEVLFDNNVIHKEKLYKLSYNNRVNEIKELLSFWK